MRTIIKISKCWRSALLAAIPLVQAGLNPMAAACPLELPLGDDLRTPATFADSMTRDTTFFMLAGLHDDRPGALVDHGDRWVVDCSALAADVISPLRETLGVDGTLDPRLLRQVFESHYLETIGQRRQDNWIKPTVTDMSAATGFADWPSRIVTFSAIKRKSRRIFRSPEGFEPALSVSQTLNTEDGNPDAEILETEIGIKRGEHDWDFYAYNDAGDLVDYSTFPAGERPSPRICIGCHYDGGTHSVSRFFP